MNYKVNEGERTEAEGPIVNQHGAKLNRIRDRRQDRYTELKEKEFESDMNDDI